MAARTDYRAPKRAPIYCQDSERAHLLTAVAFHTVTDTVLLCSNNTAQWDLFTTWTTFILLWANIRRMPACGENVSWPPCKNNSPPTSVCFQKGFWTLMDYWNLLSLLRLQLKPDYRRWGQCVHTDTFVAACQYNLHSAEFNTSCGEFKIATKVQDLSCSYPV